MTTILTCTDGSVYAPSIYDHTAWAATRLNGRVQVLHVIERHRERSSTNDLSGAIGIDASAELTQELTNLEEAQSRVARLQGKAILEEARQKLQSLGVAEVTLQHRHGSLVETVAELESHADLIVLGKRGEHAASAGSPLGSNVEEVVRVSSRPVLAASRAFAPIRKFMIAFDNSASARKAVAFVAGSSLLQGLDCHLLMVGRSDAIHERDLNAAREELVSGGFQVSAKILPGSAAAVIAAQASKDGIDLLVMGAYGHSHIREFIVGSTTTKVVRSCSIPVLLFRA